MDGIFIIKAFVRNDVITTHVRTHTHTHIQLIYIAYNDNNNNTKQFIKINFLILVLPRLETVQSFGMSSTASITTIEIKNKKKNISIVFFIETIMLWPVTCNLQTSAIRGITRPGCRVVSKITKGVISGP